MACGGLVFISMQRRRALALTAICVAAAAGYWFVPGPDSYVNRMNTIGTYEEVGDTSALSRLHYWRVANSYGGRGATRCGLQEFRTELQSV